MFFTGILLISIIYLIFVAGFVAIILSIFKLILTWKIYGTRAMNYFDTR